MGISTREASPVLPGYHLQGKPQITLLAHEARFSSSRQTTVAATAIGVSVMSAGGAVIDHRSADDLEMTA
jgi:hypothetical protein